MLKPSGQALAVALLSTIYLGLGLTAASTKSQTGDEGVHLTGGVTYWARHDYRIHPENGILPQRWCGLPIWLAGYELPSADSPAWRELSQWKFSDEYLYSLGHDVDRMLMLGRIMTAVIGVALGLLIFAWSRELFGPIAGLLSLSLFALSPTMLTHSFLITSDLAASLFFLLSVGRLWKLLHVVSVGNVVTAGLSLAGLCLSKFSAPIIVPIAGILLVIRLLNRKPLSVIGLSAFAVSGRGKQLGDYALLAASLAAFVVLSIWSAYGFRYSAIHPRGNDTQLAMPWESVTPKSKVIDESIAFVRERQLLPEAYLFGFSHVLRYSEARSAYLNGEYRVHGWLGFFPYCFAVKTPPAFFALLVVAASVSVAVGFSFRRDAESRRPGETRIFHRSKTEHSEGRHLVYELTPLLVLIVVYGVFALTTKLNIGHRHLLPIYPPLMILASVASFPFSRRIEPTKCEVAPGGATLSRWQRLTSSQPSSFIVRCIMVCLLAAHALDTLLSWPNYLAYFNLFAGGSRHAYRHLVDSSLDWSQDLKSLKKWLDAHPNDSSDPSKLYFSFFGSPPPSYYGIQCRRLPSFPPLQRELIGEPLGGGTYVVSATMLSGALAPFPGRWNKPYEDNYRIIQNYVRLHKDLSATSSGQTQLQSVKLPLKDWSDVYSYFDEIRFCRLAAYLRSREPDDRIGGSMLVYRLRDSDLAEALEGPPVELLELPEPEIEKRRLNPGQP